MFPGSGIGLMLADAHQTPKVQLCLAFLTAVLAALLVGLFSTTTARATNIDFCAGGWGPGNGWCFAPRRHTYDPGSTYPDWYSYTQTDTYQYQHSACTTLTQANVVRGVVCNSGTAGRYYYPYSVWLCYRTQGYDYAGARDLYNEAMAGHGDNYYRNC